RESGARSLLLNSETLRDKDGNPTIVVLAFQDLTPLKHAEEQLRQSQKMEAIGRLTGGIAHDFNNLLAVINGYSHLALAEMGSAHPLHHLLKEILNAGERAASLTKQLLVYSRRQIFEPKLWNLNAIVSDMSVMLERLIGEDIVLTTTLNPVSGWIKADRSQVEQILLNLVVNARDAMPEGGRLEVESGTFYLDEEYTRHHPGVVPGAYVMLRVSDTGVGMTPAVMAHIFEPFFTTKEAGKGTGLGLSVVFGIVKESGGHIDLVSQTVDATEGVRLHGHSGTTFRIYFPRADAPEDGMVESLPIESPYRGTETVLLVEDERAVREFVCRALESMGYKVLQAANGREAVEKMSRPHEPIDIVITDVVMPNMGGRELADRLTRLLPGLPVIFISGYLEQPVLRNDDSEREERFLQKPFNPMHLALTIRELLDENRERLPQRSSDG
ncbi:MAG TPA: ATP-binding protein, partial [Polyangia bacterium]